jgi:hypothetical protein
VPGFETASNLQEKRMRFMMMVKANQEYEAGKRPPPALIAAIGRLSEQMARAGILVQTGGLAPSAHGARVRVSGGQVSVTDGPFAETKELIGGYAIVEVESLDDAVDLGRKFMEVHASVLGPGYQGECEIRAMFDGANCSENASRGRTADQAVAEAVPVK